MRLLLAVALVLILCASGAYYRFFYPPVVLEHQIQAALDQFSQAVRSQSDEQTRAQRDALLADPSEVYLAVHFFSVMQAPTREWTREFDRQQFASFIDDLLVRVSERHMKLELVECTLAEDYRSALVRFDVQSAGDGHSMLASLPVMVRYHVSGQCEAQVVFSEEGPRATRLQCSTELRHVPKPSEAEKISRNPEALRQLLR